MTSPTARRRRVMSAPNWMAHSAPATRGAPDNDVVTSVAAMNRTIIQEREILGTAQPPSVAPGSHSVVELRFDSRQMARQTDRTIGPTAKMLELLITRGAQARQKRLPTASGVIPVEEVGADFALRDGRLDCEWQLHAQVGGATRVCIARLANTLGRRSSIKSPNQLSRRRSRRTRRRSQSE
jgi:hypothetical protein